MKLLLLDGNSIVNRAYYGIKLLTTKDGRFTNGIYGFLNILLRLTDMTGPDAVCVAFDVHAPTFRHKIYDAYKAGRKGMPDELKQQMPVLKELLKALGYAIVECEGWEADDIIGTLSAAARNGGDTCFIATGDRDSLQLVGGGVEVLLTATKMGRPEIIRCDEPAIAEKYGGLKPADLIEVKALMGDSSDNIPGVAGIGEKTAVALISEFGSVDGVYANLDSPSIKPGARAKLEAGRDSAYLSRTLGTISLEAPIDTDLNDYIPKKRDDARVAAMLADLEMFKLIDRFGLSDVPVQLSFDEPAAVPEFTLCELSQLGGGSADICLGDGAAYAVCGKSVAPIPEGGLAAFVRGKTVRVSDSKRLFHLVPDADVSFDSSLAAYLLNPSASGYDVPRLVQEYGVSASVSGDEGASLAAAFSLLCDALSAKIDELGQHKLLCEMEIPLARVLADMEEVGFSVDTDGIKRFGDTLEVRIGELERAIWDAVGYEFNLNSPKQLGEALFEKLGLPAGKKTKSGYSTSADVLEGLRDRHPAVEMLLEYRQLTKLKSTYCDGLLKAVSEDGRIHSTLNQTETRTGRISSTEPNLQNIPVRSELGAQMRRFFVAPEGRVLCDADYSQIELRVLADMSGDEVMCDAFNKGIDIHTVTASQVFGLPVEAVPPIMRSRAKAVNFGIVYGIGAFSLAKDIGVSFAEAKQYIEGYLAKYRGVDRYMHDVVAKASEQGFVETKFGRRRYLPELRSSDHNLRAFGERVARNAPIQGTAADIIKIAMIKVYERLKAEKLDARLILQIHDELIVEASAADAPRAAEIMSEEMQSACKLSVPIPADVHIGRDWYAAKG